MGKSSNGGRRAGAGEGSGPSGGAGKVVGSGLLPHDKCRVRRGNTWVAGSGTYSGAGQGRWAGWMNKTMVRVQKMKEGRSDRQGAGSGVARTRRLARKLVERMEGRVHSDRGWASVRHWQKRNEVSMWRDKNTRRKNKKGKGKRKTICTWDGTQTRVLWGGTTMSRGPACVR